MAELGHDCTGVDIHNVGYKHRFIKADILDWEPDQHYDFVEASPPCTNFSHVNMLWNGKNNAMKGLDLVYRVFYLINKIKPKYFVVENVCGLASFLPPPNDIIRLGTKTHAKRMAFWHNLGDLGIINHYERSLGRKDFKRQNPEVGRIPREVVLAMARKMG